MELQQDDKILPQDELKITRAENGFILSSIEECTDCEKFRINKQVIEGKPFAKTDEDNAMYQLLWQVKDFFGDHYSKHKKFNLVIEFEKNEEFED